MVGWILAWVNFSASSSVQPVEVLTTIKILFCVVPVVLYAGMFIMLSFYKLTDARVEEPISQQLIKPRDAGRGRSRRRDSRIPLTGGNMEITNPILTGFNPDPSLCRQGEDYYIATSTFEWFPGINASTTLAT